MREAYTAQPYTTAAMLPISAAQWPQRAAKRHVGCGYGGEERQSRYIYGANSYSQNRSHEAAHYQPPKSSLGRSHRSKQGADVGHPVRVVPFCD